MASLLVVSELEVGAAARDGLQAAAKALDHEAVAFEATDGLGQDALALLVHDIDPWSVVSVDDGSLSALKKAFPCELDALAPDNPVLARGYLFVSVPGFEECLDDLGKKRIAWERLKAARHPGTPF